MVPSMAFVNVTVTMVLPVYITLFLYLYFLNLTGLQLVFPTLTHDHRIYKEYGLIFTYPPIEIALWTLNVLALIMLIPAKYILTI
jgi:hypothetical protein